MCGNAAGAHDVKLAAARPSSAAIRAAMISPGIAFAAAATPSMP
jgi:hypothetical protein